jgi:hypothetical protein
MNKILAGLGAVLALAVITPSQAAEAGFDPGAVKTVQYDHYHHWHRHWHRRWWHHHGPVVVIRPRG